MAIYTLGIVILNENGYYLLGWLSHFMIVTFHTNISNKAATLLSVVKKGSKKVNEKKRWIKTRNIDTIEIFWCFDESHNHLELVKRSQITKVLAANMI